MLVKIVQCRSSYARSSMGALIVIAVALASHRPHVAQKIHGSSANDKSQSNTLGPRPPLLNVESMTAYGHIVEIEAETEPGTTVMVNGEKAAVIFAGSRIRHFVGPLPDGVTVVSITAQNDEGGVITKSMAVVLP
jgi:hypothetical protein